MPRSSTSGKGADHYVMRELNRSLVIDVLKDQGPISRASIAKATQLAKPTVSAIVEDLLASGIAREVGIGTTTSGGGRPPILIEYNAESQFVAGVHIGATTTAVVVADARGNELARVERRTVRRRPAQSLAAIADQIMEAEAAADVDRDRLVAIGVSVPGLIDLDTGVCLLAPNLGWRDVDVRGMLHESLGTSVYVHNTAQASAVAETIEGAAEGASDVVLLYAGTGVGAGILHRGTLFHGTRGISGEIGHCAVPFTTRRCSCGKVSCLETIASGPSIARAAEEAVAKGKRTSLANTKGKITAELVAKTAAEGDRVARELLVDAGRALGLAASWLVNLFNPEVVVLGGGLSGAGDALTDALQQALDESSLSHSLTGVDLRISTLGQHAEIRGALLLALQNSETYYRVIFQS